MDCQQLNCRDGYVNEKARIPCNKYLIQSLEPSLSSCIVFNFIFSWNKHLWDLQRRFDRLPLVFYCMKGGCYLCLRRKRDLKMIRIFYWKRNLWLREDCPLIYWNLTSYKWFYSNLNGNTHSNKFITSYYQQLTRSESQIKLENPGFKSNANPGSMSQCDCKLIRSDWN